MIREAWYYSHYSKRTAFNFNSGRLFRKRRGDTNIATVLLSHPRFILLAIIVIIISSLLVKEAKSVLASNAQFLIQNVILEPVEGIKVIDKEKVKEVLNLNNKSLFSVSAKKLSRILEKDPDIETAVVEKIMPDTLKITIKEKIPYALLDIGERKRCLIDKNGRVLLRNREIDSVPSINGLKLTEAVPGELYDEPNLRRILDVMHLGEKLGWDKFIEPAKIDITNEDYISIGTRERILIRFKMVDIDERMNRLILILLDAQRKGKMIKVVDLRYKDVYVE